MENEILKKYENYRDLICVFDFWKRKKGEKFKILFKNSFRFFFANFFFPMKMFLRFEKGKKYDNFFCSIYYVIYHIYCLLFFIEKKERKIEIKNLLRQI